MSRFAVVHEDPDYIDDEAYWEDKFSEWEANQGVAEKPQPNLEEELDI
jgi:hypothetical protein